MASVKSIKDGLLRPLHKHSLRFCDVGFRQLQTGVGFIIKPGNRCNLTCTFLINAAEKENKRQRTDGTDIKTSGPMLITHQGLSGPAVLKASAWGALELAQMDYKLTIAIDWLPDLVEKAFLQMTIDHARKKILSRNPFIANRLWEQLLSPFISENLTYAEAGKKKLAQNIRYPP